MTVAPIVPFDFDPGSSEYETAHLVFKGAGTHTELTWPQISQKILVPNERYYDVQEIERLNAGAFKDWDLRGFSLGAYHEFFCYVFPAHIGFRISGAEVTFGNATPLAACLYDRYHDHHFFDEWDYLSTIRIYGAARENVESILISAALAYHERYKLVPELLRFAISDYDVADEKDDSGPCIHSIAPAISDLEALRLHYNGLAQVDPVPACIYFYRVLEYFSHSTHQHEMSKLRHDASLSDEEFTRRIVDITFRDEKGPLLRLVAQIADESILNDALTAGLIKSKDRSLLGSELYGFRNSIIHSKVATGYALEASSLLAGHVKPSAWQDLLERLSARALDAYGRRLV